MFSSELDKLAVLIGRERDGLLARWREQVRQLPSAQQLDIPTLNDHIPMLLEELGEALNTQSERTIPEVLVEESAPVHGLQRLHDGFEIGEVVAEYNILRGCIHDLADNNGLILQGKPFHIINRVFDHAIGLALETYTAQRALEVRQSREEYLAFVAHDLRTPLNAISLAGSVLELILPQQNSSTEIAQMLKALQRNVQHLEGLINKVLEESTHLQSEKGIKLERREFDLWPLVEALMHDLRPVAGTADTRLINQVPDDLVVYADASLLRRVFQNLLANAIKYSPGGKVILAARELVDEGAVECSINDNGAGIPLDFLEKVFDKGETDPDNEGGAGLGLAIVKAFIEAHGGQVTVASQEGIGSTFRLTLPTKARAGDAVKR